VICYACQTEVRGYLLVTRDGAGVGPEVPICNRCFRQAGSTLSAIRRKVSTFVELPLDSPAGKVLASHGGDLGLYDVSAGRGAPWAVVLARAWPTLSVCRPSFRKVLELLCQDGELRSSLRIAGLSAGRGETLGLLLSTEEARASIQAVARIDPSGVSVVSALCDLLGVEDESGHRD
jgi:hypothetical protein